MTTPLASATELAAAASVLDPKTRRRLGGLLSVNTVEVASANALRAAGLPTIEASGLARAYARAESELGNDVARGIALGACLTPRQGPPEPALVWTTPGAPAAARRTAQVASELIMNASRSALVVGYSLTRAAGPFVGNLADAMRRGVTCTLVADRLEEKLKVFAELWPGDVGLPHLWTRPADSEDEQSALHAKFIAVDSNRLLLTSANLTYHGFHGNMEMGVLLEGRVAAEAESLVREWSKAGLISRLGPGSP